MHGLIFFYIQKYAESLPQGLGSAAGHGSGQSSIVRQAAHYLPSASYPDDEAVALLQAVAAAEGAPLGETVTRFGEFLAPHLLKVAGQLVDPSWRTLDLVDALPRTTMGKLDKRILRDSYGAGVATSGP